MNPPTPLQAQVFWMHATGMTCRMIAEELGCSPEAARSHLVQAQQKARRAGLVYSLKPKPTTMNESGMSAAMKLAREAKLI